MRGKHKNAAAHRRDRDELVSEAEDGQHRAEKAEKALAELQEKSESQIRGLRGDLAAVQRERDASASPALAEAEGHIRNLMRERDEAVEEVAHIRGNWNSFVKNAVAVLRGMGFTNTEAVEVFVASVGTASSVGNHAGVKEKGTRKIGGEGIVAIQRARGQRGMGDHFSHVASPDAQDARLVQGAGMVFRLPATNVEDEDGWTAPEVAR